MAGVLYIRDPGTGEFAPVPVLVGPQGEAGPGVPAGGAAGQVLVKSGGADYETKWQNAIDQLKGDVVESVNGILPDEIGKLTLTASNVGAMGNEVTSAALTKISTYLSNGSGSVTRVGRLVFLTFTVAVSASIPQGGEMFTIPEGYRPQSDIYVVCSGTDKTANSLNVTHDGYIRNSGTGIADNIWLNIGAMYIGE